MIAGIPKVVDDDAVEDTDGRPDHGATRKRDEWRLPVIGELSRHHRAGSKDGAHGEIQTAADDHDGNERCDDCGERCVSKDVDPDLPTSERRRLRQSVQNKQPDRECEDGRGTQSKAAKSRQARLARGDPVRWL